MRMRATSRGPGREAAHLLDLRHTRALCMIVVVRGGMQGEVRVGAGAGAASVVVGVGVGVGVGMGVGA